LGFELAFGTINGQVTYSGVQDNRSGGVSLLPSKLLGFYVGNQGQIYGIKQVYASTVANSVQYKQ